MFDKISQLSEKVNNWLHDYALPIAIIFNFLVFGLVIAAFDITYRTNDDVGMMLYIRGIGIVDQPSYEVIFMNIIFSSFIGQLYQWFAHIDWYPLSFLITIYLSYTYLFYCILKKVGNIFLKVLFVTIFLSGFILNIVYLQFTVVAGIAAIAGFTGLLSKPAHRSEEILSVVLLLLSSLIRFQSFGLVFVMFIPVYIFLLSSYLKNRKRKESFSWIWKITAITLITFMMNLYNSSKQSYCLFNSYRSQLSDYHILESIPSDQKEHILDEISWSENDYQMLIHWFFMNKDIYNINTFKTIIANVPGKRIQSLFHYLQSSKAIQDTIDILKLPTILHLFLLFITFLLFDISPKKIFFGIGVLIYLFVVYHLIAFFLKPPPERVFAVMYMATCMSPFLIHINEQGKSIADYIKISYAPVLVILLSLYPIQKILRDTRYTLWHLWKNNQSVKNELMPFSAAVEQLSRQIGGNEKLLVSWGAAFPFERIKPFEDISYLSRLSIFSLATGQQSPEAERVLKKHRITDLYTAIAERPDVYLLIGSYYKRKELELYRNYMREHYGKEVVYQELPNPLAPFNRSLLFKVSFALSPQ